MLTRKGVVNRLKSEGVYLGKNPERTFIFYQQLGLLPKSAGRLRSKNNAAIFPDWVVDRIKNIRSYQNKGKSLSVIKKAFEETDQVRREWIQKLNLRNPEQIKSIRLHLIRDERMGYFVSIFYADKVEWLKVNKITDLLYTIDKDVVILDRRTLSWEQYGQIIKELAVRLGREGHTVLKERDIPLAIFLQNRSG